MSGGDTENDGSERSEAARRMGQARTPEKARAVRENGRKGGRPQKPLDEIACTCRGEGLDHSSTCPRGRAIRRRTNAEQAKEGSGSG
jgi:hypothetical protein